MTIVWSHSALKDYENCARKYHEVRVLKKYKSAKTEQILYGEELHKAAEEFVRDGTALPPQFTFVESTIQALLTKGPVALAEQQMAVTADLTPCDWKDPDVWVRGIADILILDEANKIAWVADYKTGSNKYPDKDQLELMSILVFQHHPWVKTVQAALLFVVKDSMVKHKVHRADADKIWWRYRERVGAIEASTSNNVWNPKQSGLCKKYCPVSTCEYNGNH